MNNKSLQVENQFPLSPVQEGMLFHYMHKKDKTYMEQLICDIDGELNLEIFEETINKLIEVNESLRTVFQYKQTEILSQTVLNEKKVQLEIRNIMDEQDKESYIERCVQIEADKNFDLSKETFRCVLFKITSDKYVFLCTFHHLIADAWTLKILGHDFSRIYYDLSENLRRDYERYNYSSYLEWIDKQSKEKARKYWVESLAPYEKNGKSETYRMDQVDKRETLSLKLDSQVASLIDGIKKESKVTINTVLLAAWGIYLLEHYQKEELIFGCVVFGRMIGLKNIEKISGLFVNSIPLYVNSNTTAMQFLRNIQMSTLTAGPYSYLSLSEMMAYANLTASDVCSFVNFSIDSTEVDNEFSRMLPIKVHNIRYNEQANYQVYLDIYIEDESIEIKVHYDAANHYFNSEKVKDALVNIITIFLNQPTVMINRILDNLSTNNELEIDADFNF